MSIVVLLGLFALVVVVIWITAGLISLLITLVIAGLIGGLADAIIPGRAPFGWLGAILAGLVGSWVGTALIGHVGPSFFGIPLIPAFVGAMILVAVAEIFMRMSRRREY